MKIPLKKVPKEYYNRVLFPSNIFDSLPKNQNHERFLYKDIFQQIDTSEIEKKYSRKGQNAYHPRFSRKKLLLSWIIHVPHNESISLLAMLLT